MAKIEPLQAFKNRLVGMGLVAGALGSVLIKFIEKHIS